MIQAAPHLAAGIWDRERPLGDRFVLLRRDKQHMHLAGGPVDPSDRDVADIPGAAGAADHADGADCSQLLQPAGGHGREPRLQAGKQLLGG